MYFMKFCVFIKSSVLFKKKQKLNKNLSSSLPQIGTRTHVHTYNNNKSLCAPKIHYYIRDWRISLYTRTQVHYSSEYAGH